MIYSAITAPLGVIKRLWRKKTVRTAAALALILAVLFALSLSSYAAEINIDLTTGEQEDDTLGTIQLLFMLTLLSLAPSLLIMLTCFTRVVIVLSFVRNAVGLQQTPPNQVIIGLALFLSLFIMGPTLTEVNETGLEPYLAGDINMDEALDNMQLPIKEFMLRYTDSADLDLFLSLSNDESITEIESTDDLLELPLTVVAPAFMTSELSRAFTIGFLLFLPFLVIDMIVSSTLMSMGMVMLPPSMIALPFKLMLFVVVDGWRLIMEMLVSGFLG